MSIVKSQLFIADKLRVGFVSRSDTYSGKIAFIIYYDNKGILHQESTLQGWLDRNKDKSSGPVEFENKPTEGFVLNKGVGGQRQSYGYHARNEYCRVYDPRDFEIEISFANLLFILREGGCSPGKGLEGKFVYAWDGARLVLLPIVSQEYKNSRVFMNLKEKTVGVKELVPGATYLTKKQESMTYLGKFDYHFVIASRWRRTSPEDKLGISKRYVFWTGETFEYRKDIKSLAERVSDTIHPEFAELVDRYNKSSHGSKIVRLFLKESTEPLTQSDYYNPWYVEDPEGLFTEYTTHYRSSTNQEIYCINRHHIYRLKEGRLVVENEYANAYPPGSSGHCWKSNAPWIEPTNQVLWVELESGVELPYNEGDFERG